jgi:hypothetical protein
MQPVMLALSPLRLKPLLLPQICFRCPDFHGFKHLNEQLIYRCERPTIVNSRI